MTFGSRLQSYRKTRDIKVKDISRELIKRDNRRNAQFTDNDTMEDLINNFRRTYYNWEQDISYPDIIQLDILCDFLDCDYDFLMCKIDTPSKDVYDVQQVTGLSEKAVTYLKNLYDKTKPIEPSPFPFHYPNEFKSLDDTIRNMELQTHKAIDLMLCNEDNSEDYNFFMNIGMYLFGQYQFENNLESIKLIDDNGTTIMRCYPDMVKATSLNSIMYQLQKWSEDIEKNKQKRSESL